MRALVGVEVKEVGVVRLVAAAAAAGKEQAVAAAPRLAQGLRAAVVEAAAHYLLQMYRAVAVEVIFLGKY